MINGLFLGIGFFEFMTVGSLVILALFCFVHKGKKDNKKMEVKSNE